VDTHITQWLGRVKTIRENRSKAFRKEVTKCVVI
jgi:hypothetical protein